MFWFILSIISIIAGLVMYFFLFADENKKFRLSVLICSVALSCLLLFFSVINSVPTGHTGVVTIFGRVENYTLDSGVHFLAPWAKVIKMDNRIQKETIELSCFSADIQEVSMVYTVNYQIDKVNAMTIYRTIGKDYYKKIIVPAITESVKIVTARYTAE